MKPKSNKTRLLATLEALWKYSDKDHTLNTPKLNEFLTAYDLKNNSPHSFCDTVNIMKEFGIDARTKGRCSDFGAWIEGDHFND